MNDRAVPVLPSAGFVRTAKFFRYFGFGIIAEDDHWLRLRNGSVELDFCLKSPDQDAPENPAQSGLCVIRVGDAAAWHDIFAKSRMAWKAFGKPSLTSLSNAAWNVPAFAVTDPDGNLIWIVQDEPPSNATE